MLIDDPGWQRQSLTATSASQGDASRAAVITATVAGTDDRGVFIGQESRSGVWIDTRGRLHAAGDLTDVIVMIPSGHNGREAELVDELRRVRQQATAEGAKAYRAIHVAQVILNAVVSEGAGGRRGGDV